LQKQTMKFKLEGLGNIITLTVFTLLPIILFASILVLKLRENYLQEIEHLKTNNMQGFQSLNMCLSDLSSRESNVNRLHEEQHLCRLTMAKVSETVDHLSQALRDQLAKHKATKSRMTEQAGKLETAKTEKDNMTLKLKAENLNLSSRVLELTQLVDNLTMAKSDLEGRLDSVLNHVDTLKTNTNRLEGEKKGLEKVLVVKEALQTIATKNGTSETGNDKEAPTGGDESIKKILKGLESSPLLSSKEEENSGNSTDNIDISQPQSNKTGTAQNAINSQLKTTSLKSVTPVLPVVGTNISSISVSPELKPISKILKHLETSPLLEGGEIKETKALENNV